MRAGPPLKVLLIGTGFGERVVAPIYRELGAELAIVSPRDGEAVRAACARGADLVSVHSPPFLHLDHVMAALERGCAVLCDKPFGRDAAEARGMRDRAVQAGALHFLNFEFRRQPSRVRLKQLLADGAIGALRHVSWQFIGSGLRKQRHRWLFDAAQAGGWIGAYGSHAIDTLRWLFDDEIADCGGISRIETLSRPDRDGVEQPATAEDAFTAWFRMAHGGSVSFDTAYSTPIDLPHRLVLLGSEGALELIDEQIIEIRRFDTGTEKIAFDLPAGDPHESGLRPWLGEVITAVRDGRQIAPSFEDGLAAAAAMDRLREGLIRVEGEHARG